MEPQVIEYISNPAKFKEDLEVAILEGKATGETVLKSIENIVNGGNGRYLKTLRTEKVSRMKKAD